jgi:uncharacterized cofD-like protein
MALGDYAQASAWLGQQLGIDGAVLPATIEPVRWNIDVLSRAAVIKSLTGVGPVVRQLQFVGDRIRSPEVAIDAVRRARWVLLAPGALYGCVLAAAAVPDLAAALTGTSARVVWIANLEPDRNDAANMSAIDHLLVLRRHGVRVDVVLHDGSAMLKFDPTELAVHGVESVSRRLGTGANPPRHDPDRLRSALAALIGSKRAGTDRGRPRQ